MTQRRPKSIRMRDEQDRRHRARLRLEPLEARRLLAGLQVSVFVDNDGSRDFDETSDSRAAERLVFVDLNRNGSFEADEPIAATSQDGLAYFADLPAGDYSIGLLTNPASQRQVTSTRVSPNASQVHESASEFLLEDSTGSVWAVSRAGIALREGESIELGGAVRDSAQVGQETFLLVEPSVQHPSGLIRFNLTDGSTENVEIDSTSEPLDLTAISAAGDGLLAIGTDQAGVAKVVELQLSGLQAAVAYAVDSPATAIAGSPSQSLFAIAEPSSSGSRIVLHGGAINARGVFYLEHSVDSLRFNQAGDQLAASMADGGVRVLDVKDGQLSLVAILEESAAPLAFSEIDHRLLTGSTQNPAEITVWDMESWKPLGTTFLPASAAAIEELHVDALGDQVLLGTSSGLYQADLAVQANAPVHLDDQQVAQMQFGVRVVGSNSEPDVSSANPISVQEDESNTFRIADSGVTDADGDRLWFSLNTGPKHGELNYSRDGDWNYVPNPNFAGQDSAVFTVLDGMSATELVIRWDVEAINDPPVAIHIQLPPLPENPTPGSPIGFVSVEDPDSNPSYRVTTSDSRFSVQGGQIYFVDGELDFDTEPNVIFQVIATDQENGDYVITREAVLRLTNVDESPTGLELTNSQVAENMAGAEIGVIRVLDPDSDSDYDFEVSDQRFEIRDGVLRLLAGEELDYEENSSIALTISATSANSSDTLTESVTVDVENRNDAPTGIELSGTSVTAEEDGASIGQLTVLDQDGDNYEFSVADGRFEVVEGVLKLRPGNSIEEATPNFSVAVSASSRNGDAISRTFPVIVLPPVSPHQNPRLPNDVNGDGRVSPIDVLILINEINRTGGGRLPPPDGGSEGEPRVYPDIDGNGYLTPSDVLQVINDLNNQPKAESEFVEPQFASVCMPASFDDMESKEAKLALDHELEQLLEELSVQHRNRA